MTIYRIRLAETFDQGLRGVALLVDGPSLVAGIVRARFQRWGYPRPYLHANGWGVGEGWIELLGEASASDQLTLRLPSNISSHLEENSNYRISLMPLGGASIEQGVRWSVTGIAKPQASALTSVVPRSEPVTAAGVAARNVDAAWTAAQDLNSREAYAAFLKTYPVSTYADVARNALEALLQVQQSAHPEELAWQKASQIASKAAWTEFVLTYPNGHYAERAKVELASFLPAGLTVRTHWSGIGSAAPYGVDTCAFLLTAAGVVRDDADFISSWATDQATGARLHDSRCASVRNRGDTLDRSKNLHTETLAIDLDKVPPDIKSIAITASLDTRVAELHRIAAVDATVEVIDAVRDQVLLHLDVGEGAIGAKARVLLTLRRRGADWVLHRSTEAFVDGIFGACKRFGVMVN